MKLEIAERTPFAHGYEMLSGRAHHAIDPAALAHRTITDIDLVPRDAQGHVTFSADFRILRPLEAASRNRLLFDWGNRGNLRALVSFNDAPWTNDPRTPEDAGNGFLMRQGYTVVWAAWQGDLLPGERRLLLDLPVATASDGGPIAGPVRVEYVGAAGVRTMPLSGWDNTRSHPTHSLDATQASLTRRRYADSPRQPVPDWSFATETNGTLTPSAIHLHIPAGFQPGWIYELVYNGTAPLPLALGHVAVRDLVAFLRYDESSENPCAFGIDRAYGWGVSQTGRAIRDFIHQGFNADTQGRKVFDGLLPHVSGAGLLNTARFANLTALPSQQYEEHFGRSDRFPFAYAPTTDHLTGKTDAILKRPNTDPLVIHTQTATEYWQRRGSLVHTDTRGNDLPIPDNARIYLWASSQHAADPNRTAPERGLCQNLWNVVGTTALFRAMLAAMDDWASNDIPPPASRIPTRADGTLITIAEWRAQFPVIPGTGTPTAPNRFPLLDFGPESAAGLISKEPPGIVSETGYAVRLPAVDVDGNDIPGVRAPMVAAPLATYTGWNLRARGHGTGAMHEFSGSTLPFPDSAEERAMTSDPRRAVAERYPNAAAYTAAIAADARALVAERFMLEEDIARAEARAANWHAPQHDVGLDR